MICCPKKYDDNGSEFCWPDCIDAIRINPNQSSVFFEVHMIQMISK